MTSREARLAIWRAANKERIQEYNRQYGQRPEVKEARRRQYHANRALLADQGLLPKMGRPRLYHSLEELKLAKRMYNQRSRSEKSCE